MSSKPGRKWAPLRGEYAEVRELAEALRALADSHGLTLRDIAERVPYGRSAISTNLNGEDRPSWGFVTHLLEACTDGDRHAYAVLERKIQPLWDTAAPGRANHLPNAPRQNLVSQVPGNTSLWITSMKDTAAALERVSRAQLSASRNLELIQALTFMMGKLSAATQTLTEERDALRVELLSRVDSATELLQTRSLLEDTQRRLGGAEQLLEKTSRRLDEAQHQREEAERLKRTVRELMPVLSLCDRVNL
jgi:transcriptional regulator with XRE-family HTH domain